MNRIRKPAPPVDANCVTAGDGSCVSVIDCMHGPAQVSSKYERMMDRRTAIGWLRGILNLTDWEIRLHEAPLDGEFFATLDKRDLEKVAQLTLDDHGPVEMDTSNIAHELVHLAMHPFDELTDRILMFVPEGQARVTFIEMIDDARETFVDTMARALVPSAPRFMAYGDLAESWPAFAHG